MMKSYYSLAYIIISFFYCNSQNCNSLNLIPENITEGFEILECNLGSEVFYQMLELDKNEFVNRNHFGIGLFIRNNWGLWSNHSCFYREFEINDIYHPDEISSVFLGMFYDFHCVDNFNTLTYFCSLDVIKNQIRKSQEMYQLQMEKYYDTFKINDTVSFEFDIDFDKNNNKNVQFISKKSKGDCIGVAKVVSKMGLNSRYGYTLELEVLSVCSHLNLFYRNKPFKSGSYFNYYIERNDITLYEN